MKEIIDNNIFSGNEKLVIYGAYSSISVSHYCNGALLIFESEEEINSLINMMRKALKWKKEQKSSSNLFFN